METAMERPAWKKRRRMASVTIQTQEASMRPVSTKAERLSIFAVAVVVLIVGGAVGDLHGEEGDGGGDEVDGGVRGFGEHAERTGEEAGDELEDGDDEGGEHGEEGGGALGGARRSLCPAGRVVSGRGAHGSDGTASR